MVRHHRHHHHHHHHHCHRHHLAPPISISPVKPNPAVIIIPPDSLGICSLRRTGEGETAAMLPHCKLLLQSLRRLQTEMCLLPHWYLQIQHTLKPSRFPHCLERNPASRCSLKLLCASCQQSVYPELSFAPPPPLFSLLFLSCVLAGTTRFIFLLADLLETDADLDVMLTPSDKLRVMLTCITTLLFVAREHCTIYNSS